MKLAACKALTVIISALFLYNASAGLITGKIEFAGMATLDKSMESATEITGYPFVFVRSGSQSDDYSSVPGGTLVDWKPFNFSDTSVIHLWEFKLGSVDYWFDATSISIKQQNVNALDLQGEGIAHIDGFMDTLGTWTITSTGGNTTFTFGASANSTGQSPTVPDIASTGGLLAFALAGLTSRKLRKA